MSTRRSRGSIATMAALFTGVLSVLILAGVTLGRVAIARREAQEIADASALAAAEGYREQGRALQLPRAQTLGMQNVNVNGPEATAQVTAPRETDNGTKYVVESRSSVAIPVPRLLNPAGRVELLSRAEAKGDQLIPNEVSNPLADMTLVLDYSGSMGEAMGGGTRLEALKSGINEALTIADGKVRFSAILYSTGIVDQLDYSKAAIGAIEEMVMKNDASSGTDTAAGLRTAGEHFVNEWERNESSHQNKKFVLLVSDGEPNDVGAAMAASDALFRLRDSQGECISRPVVYTLHIGGGGNTAQFMRDVSGPPADCKTDTRPCSGQECWQDHYFRADSRDALIDTLREIISKLLCHTPAPTLADSLQIQGENGIAPVRDARTVRAFLRTGGGEVPLRRRENLEELFQTPGEMGFAYSSGTLHFTKRACDQINGGSRVVIRYNHPRLSR